MINVKSLITRGVLVLACGTTAFTVNTMASQTAHAATASTTAMLMPALEAAGQLRPDWAGRTCSAFSRWQAKPTVAHLDTLVRDSLHLPHGYLQADVLQLAANALTAKPNALYVSDAGQYVYEDCHNGYGL